MLPREQQRDSLPTPLVQRGANYSDPDGLPSERRSGRNVVVTFLLVVLLAAVPIVQADTGIGLSDNITVDTGGTPSETSIAVSGRVLSQSTELPLAGVTVTLAGLTATTGSNGAFSLVNVDLAAGATATFSLAGYLSQSQTVTATTGEKSVNIGDILLHLETDKPVVEWLRTEGNGIYLAGFGLVLPLRARVNWNGNIPGSVDFYANQSLITTINDPGPEYAASVNVDNYFSPTLQIGGNRISAIATSAAGVPPNALLGVAAPAATGVLIAEMPVIPLPSALSSVVSSSLFQIFGPNQVGFDFQFLPIEHTINLPVLGKFGFAFGANASFDYTLNDGAWELSVGAGAEGNQGKRGRRPTFPGITRFPKTKLYIGNKEIGATVTATFAGTATRSSGIVLNEWGGTLELSAHLELGRFGLDRLIDPTGMVISSIPGIAEILKVQQVVLYATPQIGGSVVMFASPVKFKEGTATGGIGIEARYEPAWRGVDLSIYAGGRADMEFGYPAPVFRNVQITMYAGAKAFWNGIEMGPEGVWDLYKYPPSAQLSTVGLLQGAATTTVGRWQPMGRPWRHAGPESFLLESVAGSALSAAQADSAALDLFRRMGESASPGTTYAPKAAAGVFGANMIGNDPALPAQATLPLLANVFPISEPSLAARTSELILLYVRDTGVANPVQFTEIAFTRFDGTSWSTPAAVAPDPRGQFSPQVVFDGAGNAVAIWEQIKDAAFTGSDLQTMTAQMEIMTAVWDPATQSWTAPAALTNNTVLDHLPRLAGPLTDGDLLMTWIQNDANQLVGTGASGAVTNSRVMSMRWDSTTETWGTADTLVANLTNELSDSLAASANKAVYLWSKDGDGNLDDLSNAELFYRVYNATTGLWVAETRYTNDAIADRNAKVLLDPTGGVYAVWQRGNDLMMDRDFLGTPTAVRADSTTMGFADFALTLGPGGNVLAIWQEMSEAGSDAHYRVFDPASNTWSLDSLLSNDAALERSFAPVWDAVGNLVLAYNNVEIVKVTKTVALEGGGTVDIPGVPQPGQVDLFAARRALVKDLGFGGDGLTAEGATFLPGDAVTLKAKVRNTGNVAVENVQVAFYDGDPGAGGTLIQTVTIPGWLKASDEQEASILWTVPLPAAAHTAFAVIDPAGQVTEFSESNNTSSLALNGVDLQLEYVSGSVLRDGSVRVVARVKNIGAPASPASSLKLWPKVAPGANPLASVEVSLLNPGDSVEIPLDLPAGAHPEGDVAYRLTVDEDDLAEDIDRTNNEVLFALNLFIDEDGDGLSRAWEQANGLSDANAADADEDRDGDGFTSRQEYLAGTNPNNGNSFLKAGEFNVVQNPGGPGVISTISWASVAGRLYAVERSFDLDSWQRIADNIEANPPLNSTTDTVIPPAGRVYYKIVVK